MALAEVLFGEVNPSGKLPTTFPKALEDTPAYRFGEFPGNGIRFDLRPDFECLAGQKFRSGDLADQTAAGGADLSDFNRLPGGVDQSEGVLPAFRRRVGAEIGHAISRHLQSARRQPAAEETSQNHLR